MRAPTLDLGRREHDLVAELGEELRDPVRAVRRHCPAVQALEELRGAKRRPDLPSHASRTIAGHLVSGPCGHFEGLARLISPVDPVDRRPHHALEDLEPLYLPWVKVLGRKLTAGAVGRLHLEQLPRGFGRCPDQAQPKAVVPVDLLTCLRHSGREYLPVGGPDGARGGTSPAAVA